MEEEVPISCSWQDPDEEDIEKLCFDADLDKQDSNEADPICAPKIAAKNEPNDDMSCLPHLDSEAEVQGSVYVPTETIDPDEEEKEVNNSQNELCQAHGLKVSHVQKVTEALRILVRDPLIRKSKEKVAHVLSEEKSELSEENIHAQPDIIYAFHCNKCGKAMLKKNHKTHLRSNCSKKLGRKRRAKVSVE